MARPHRQVVTSPKKASVQSCEHDRRERMRLLDHELKRLFPSVRIALQYSSPWELLVAVILSAQCTDKKVNEVTVELFKRYQTIRDYATAERATLERDIHATGFFRTKAAYLIGAAQRIQAVHGGGVPRTMTDMLTLPGVARKTANVVLGNAFGIVAGIAVDTHVRRFVVRYDLSDSTDPVVIERDLMSLVPKDDWLGVTHRIIAYGRTIAPARPYDISHDPLVAIYPRAGERFRV